MLFTTPEQFVVLATLLLGGLLIGYALTPSPKKWKRRVREQSDSFTEYHRDAEDRVRAANQRATDLSAEADALRADHAEAERTIAALRAAAAAPPEPAPRPALSLVETAPVVHEPVAEPAPAPVAEPVVTAEADHHPAEPTDVEHVVESVPDPQLAAEIIPAHAYPRLGAVEEIAPQPEPLAEAEPLTEPAPEPVAEADTAETAPDPHDHTPAFKPIDVAPMTPTPTDAAPAPIGAAEPEMPVKGWFASSARDDLTRLRGVDTVLNTRLFGLGVTRFEDVEKLSAEDEMALEQRLSLPVGYVAREQWRTQAALLRAGQDEEHAAHFGATEPAPTA